MMPLMTESETRHAEPENDLETRHAKRRNRPPPATGACAPAAGSDWSRARCNSSVSGSMPSKSAAISIQFDRGSRADECEAIETFLAESLARPSSTESYADE
jgi:hypothetical protein